MATQHVTELHVRVVSARGLKDTQTFGTQDPFASVVVGNRKFKTKVHDNGGKMPIWNEKFVFTIYDMLSEQLHLSIKNKNFADSKLIGECRLQLSMFQHGQVVDQWFTLNNGNERAGDVNLRIQLVGQHNSFATGAAAGGTNTTGIQNHNIAGGSLNTYPGAAARQQQQPQQQQQQQQPQRVQAYAPSAPPPAVATAPSFNYAQQAQGQATAVQQQQLAYQQAQQVQQDQVFAQQQQALEQQKQQLAQQQAQFRVQQQQQQQQQRQQQPVYAQPQPVYAQPQPVYVQPPQPQTIVVQQPVVRHGYGGGYGHHGGYSGGHVAGGAGLGVVGGLLLGSALASDDGGYRRRGGDDGGFFGGDDGGYRGDDGGFFGGGDDGGGFDFD